MSWEVGHGHIASGAIKVKVLRGLSWERGLGDIAGEAINVGAIKVKVLRGWHGNGAVGYARVILQGVYVT